MIGEVRIDRNIGCISVSLAVGKELRIDGAQNLALLKISMRFSLL